MATTVTESLLVRRPVDEVAAVATDPGVLLPTVAGLGRFAFISRAEDGSELWDMFLDIGTVHVGGRVHVVRRDRALVWDAVRGTRHSMRVEVTEQGDDALVTMAMTVELAGRLLGRVAELVARGIARRHLVAGLQQIRHRVEFSPLR